MREPKIYLKIILNISIVILGVLFCVFLLPKLFHFFLPFVIGWIISVIANPLVKFMERKIKIVRKHSSAIIIIVVIGLVIGAIGGIGFILVRECITLVEDLPNIIEKLEAQIDIVVANLNGLYKILPDGMQEVIDNFGLKMDEYIASFLSNFDLDFSLTGAGVIAKTVADGFLKVIITVLSSYFFIAQRDEIISGTKKVMPESVQKNYNLVVENFKIAVGGYFKAQFKIMLILLAIMFIGFEIMGISFSFLLAFLISFLDFLPVFGTGAILWPWTLFELFSGNYGRVVFLLVIYLICQIVKQVLQPKMVGDSIGINPLVALLFMFIGYQFMGILGMIIGIPIGMILTKFYRLGMFDNLIRSCKMLIHDINEYRKF